MLSEGIDVLQSICIVKEFNGAKDHSYTCTISPFSSAVDMAQPEEGALLTRAFLLSIQHSPS